jgi:anti-anti-sigma factor
MLGRGDTMMQYQASGGYEAAPRACGGSRTDLLVREVGNYIVFEIGGPLALAWASDELSRVVRQLLHGSKKNIILDLAQASFADSSGIGALAATLNLVQSAGGSLVLLSIQPRVMSLLTRLHLDSYFTFSSDRTLAFAKT